MKKLSSSSGFTIVEIIVAVAVGSIIFGTAINTLVSQERLSQSNKNTVIANAFAEAKIEALRSQGYLAIPGGNTDISSELPATLPPPKQATLQIDASTAGLKEIVLTITYNNSGATKSEQYKTIIGELGVGQN